MPSYSTRLLPVSLQHIRSAVNQQFGGVVSALGAVWHLAYAQHMLLMALSSTGAHSAAWGLSTTSPHCFPLRVVSALPVCGSSCAAGPRVPAMCRKTGRGAGQVAAQCQGYLCPHLLATAQQAGLLLGFPFHAVVPCPPVHGPHGVLLDAAAHIELLIMGSCSAGIADKRV